MRDLHGHLPINLAHEPDFFLGGAQVHPSSREIRFGETLETIEPRVMQVLVALARQRGKVVSRDDLVHQCWEGRAVGEDAINRCLAKVRRLTERMRDVMLETVPRVGYRLSEAPGTAVNGRKRPSGRAMAIVTGIILLLIVFGTLGYSITREDDPARQKFAVLPFTSLNSGEEMHLYGKGIGAATAAALNRAGLTLVSTAPFPAKAENNPADVGRALGADYVVTGSVRQEGAIIRAFARVERVEGATTIYSRVFQVPVSQKHLLPDFVAKGIAGALPSTVISCRKADPTGRACSDRS